MTICIRPDFIFPYKKKYNTLHYRVESDYWTWEVDTWSINTVLKTSNLLTIDNLLTNMEVRPISEAVRPISEIVFLE